MSFRFTEEIHDPEEEEFEATYRKRYRFISHKEYSVIPVRIQLPTCPDVYNTEHIFVPKKWDPQKRMRFITFVYNTLKPQSRL